MKRDGTDDVTESAGRCDVPCFGSRFYVDKPIVMDLDYCDKAMIICNGARLLTV